MKQNDLIFRQRNSLLMSKRMINFIHQTSYSIQNFYFCIQHAMPVTLDSGYISLQF